MLGLILVPRENVCGFTNSRRYYIVEGHDRLIRETKISHPKMVKLLQYFPAGVRELEVVFLGQAGKDWGSPGIELVGKVASFSVVRDENQGHGAQSSGVLVAITQYSYPGDFITKSQPGTLPRLGLQQVDLSRGGEKQQWSRKIESGITNVRSPHVMACTRHCCVQYMSEEVRIRYGVATRRAGLKPFPARRQSRKKATAHPDVDTCQNRTALHT
ncbi:hypothetical protein N658DRAFT_352085 [Parathielavia hyrcaniae]|uniref:Uncharacterized protein n=1 Tax=Parathielavia hyrcaniae TaxID=113614 RepID=A0AAN6T289_9PEZI|nr:hypothetical protein N658DRAFT_352085 [Parathielavia hyrcaniae]